MTSPAFRRRLPIVFRTTIAGALAGTGFALFQLPGIDVMGDLVAVLRGTITGVLIAFPAGMFELFFIETSTGERLRRASFGLLVAVKTALYLMFICVGLVAGQLVGNLLSAAPDHSTAINLITVLFGLGISFIINFVLSVNRLLGRGVLFSLVTGRYHRPRVETRFFLFIDMANSTAIAEKIGNENFHRLLNRFFSDLSGPISECRGTFHKYVGDEAIITWTLHDGSKDARTLRAFFLASDHLMARQAGYRATFGVEPEFRAALHCGDVITGEMGDVLREIAFLGEAINTTARIEQICKERRLPFLVSAAALRHFTVPAGLRPVSIGPTVIPGQTELQELFRVETAGQ